MNFCRLKTTKNINIMLLSGDHFSHRNGFCRLRIFPQHLAPRPYVKKSLDSEQGFLDEPLIFSYHTFDFVCSSDKYQSKKICSIASRRKFTEMSHTKNTDFVICENFLNKIYFQILNYVLIFS